MQLKCILKRTDFIPFVKHSGKLWQPETTLAFGSILNIDDLIGHQLLASHPGAFEVVGYGEAPQPDPKRSKKKQIGDESLKHVDSSEPIHTAP